MLIAFAVAQDKVLLPLIIGRHERTIVVLYFHGGEQLPVAKCLRPRAEDTLKPIRTDGRGYLIRNRVPVAHPHGTNRAEVPHIGVIRPCGVGQSVSEFRNHEVQVGVALSMRMGGLIDRHAVDVGLEIRPVIQVVSPHQVLVRFSLAAMQCHDEPRHRFQQLTRPIGRQHLKLLVGHHTLARGLRRSQEFEALGRHRNFLQ